MSNVLYTQSKKNTVLFRYLWRWLIFDYQPYILHRILYIIWKILIYAQGYIFEVISGRKSKNFIVRTPFEMGANTYLKRYYTFWMKYVKHGDLHNV